MSIHVFICICIIMQVLERVVAFLKRTRAANNMIALPNICACPLQDNVLTWWNCAIYLRRYCCRRLYSNFSVTINIKLQTVYL